MNTVLKPLRWCRFRLRTVLLLVTLLAIPCAWIGSEWKIVHERAALIQRVAAAGGEFDAPVENYADVLRLIAAAPTILPPKSKAGRRDTHVNVIVIEPGVQLVPVSGFRRWLGDYDVSSIEIPGNFPDDDEKRILELFPQTKVSKVYPALQNPQIPPGATRTH